MSCAIVVCLVPPVKTVNKHIQLSHCQSLAMERWVGRVALVTGASAGIGYELAERLVQHGMKVVGCARNIEKIQVLSTNCVETQTVRCSI